jgi:hypothetical protein
MINLATEKVQEFKAGEWQVDARFTVTYNSLKAFPISLMRGRKVVAMFSYRELMEFVGALANVAGEVGEVQDE